MRFLRNAIVAKVAGDDSSLLQISSDERKRVARVAAVFSEEDLARHLQIMLRTHGELGYRQEQRFHLELGLLKMAHAQRLLPIEEILSEAAAPALAAAVGSFGALPESRGEPETPSIGALHIVSPFAADSARKTGSKPEMSLRRTRRDRARVPWRASTARAWSWIGGAGRGHRTRTSRLSDQCELRQSVQSTFRGAVLDALATRTADAGAMLETGEWRWKATKW